MKRTTCLPLLAVLCRIKNECKCWSSYYCCINSFERTMYVFVIRGTVLPVQNPVPFHRCTQRKPRRKWIDVVEHTDPCCLLCENPQTDVAAPGSPLFLVLLLSGSGCCARTPPTRTWAPRWRTSADWSTATWGTCTPSLMTRRWWVHSARPAFPSALRACAALCSV